MFCWPRNTENVPATSYTETLRYQREDATQLQPFHTHHSSHVSFCLSKGTRSKEVNCIADSKGTKMSKCFYYTQILILALPFLHVKIDTLPGQTTGALRNVTPMPVPDQYTPTELTSWDYHVHIYTAKWTRINIYFTVGE